MCSFMKLHVTGLCEGRGEGEKITCGCDAEERHGEGGGYKTEV